MPETLSGSTSSPAIVLPQNSDPGRRSITPPRFNLFPAFDDAWPLERTTRAEMPPLADLMKHISTVQRSPAHLDSLSSTERWIWSGLAVAGIGCGMLAGATFAGSNVVDPLTSLLAVLGICALVATVRHWGWQREHS